MSGLQNILFPAPCIPRYPALLATKCSTSLNIGESIMISKMGDVLNNIGLNKENEQKNFFSIFYIFPIHFS